MGSSTESNGIPTLDLTVSDEDFEGGAKTIIQHIRPEWKQESLKFKVFTDGISNKLLGCYLEGDAENMILVRMNGQGGDLLIDRKEELENFKFLSDHGCAPPLHAVFQNGIAYGFFPGSPLDERSVRDPKIQRLIAEEMVRLHETKGKEAEGGPVSSQYRSTVQGFLNAMPTSFEDPVKQKEFVKTFPSKQDLVKEFNLIMEQLEGLHMDTVFSHNDLLLKNIIYNEKKGTIHFIDYEYAFYNYHAFDIGNHFTEYAGISEIDYSLYPTKTEQWPFLKHYLVARAKVRGLSEGSVTEKDVERLYVQVNKCACASHFLWAIWAVVQARYSPIDFDYFGFGDSRLTEYFRRKEEFFALKLPS